MLIEFITCKIELNYLYRTLNEQIWLHDSHAIRCEPLPQVNILSDKGLLSQNTNYHTLIQHIIPDSMNGNNETGLEKDQPAFRRLTTRLLFLPKIVMAKLGNILPQTGFFLLNFMRCSQHGNGDGER